jgi:hypothetical protein
MDVEVGWGGGIDAIETFPKLKRPMPGMTGANHNPALDVERGKQRRGAVPDVIMRAAFGLDGPHRQQGRRAVEGLDVALLVDAQYQRAVGRVQIQPHDVADLLDEEGILRQLERLGSVRLERERLHMRAAADWLSPTCVAKDRVLQCVASRGVDSSVVTIARSTAASVTRRGAPGRGSASNPSTRASANRRRHLPTVCFVMCRSASMAVWVSPAAHRNTIRARSANACAVVRTPRGAFQGLTLAGAQYDAGYRTASSHVASSFLYTTYESRPVVVSLICDSQH